MGLPERTRSFLQSHFGFVLEDIVTDKDGQENIGVLLPYRLSQEEADCSSLPKEGLTRLDSEELERYMSFMTGEKG